MKFGTLYSYWGNEWSCNYSEIVERVSRLGFDILEIGAGHLLELSELQISDLRSKAEKQGIEITCNIGPAKDKDVASAKSSTRRDGIDFLSNIMKAMKLLGSNRLVGVQYTYWPNDFSDLDKVAIWARGVDSVKELAQVAEGYGIHMCLEVVNRFETHILNTGAEALDFCKEVGNDNVNILMDTFHMNIEEDNISDAIRAVGGKLGHLHVGEGNRKLPGEGSLPWKEIGKALRDIKYTGGVVMEPFYFKDGQVGKDIKVWRDLSDGASREEMDQKITKSLQFIKSIFLKGSVNG